MGDNWKIRVDIQAYVDWREPPKDREEEVLREIAGNMVKAKAAAFEKELAAILTSDLIAMR